MEHIERRKNEATDALSRLGSRREKVPPNVFLDELHHPSVKLPSAEELAFPDPESALVAAARTTSDWTEPYLGYLLRGELPADEVKQRQLIRRCKSYTLIDGEFSRRSPTGVYERCASPEEG